MTTRVVVTGALGAVGRAIVPALGRRYDVVQVDARRRPIRGVRRADLTRPRSARRALAGADVVVDLASSHWQAEWPTVLGNNVRAAWNVLEAAHAVGARRVVYASSNHVVGRYEHDDPYDRVLAGDHDRLRPATLPVIGVDAPLRPDTPYAVGKIAVEAAARYFSDVHGLSVVCLRIGTLNTADRPLTDRHFSTWISHRDLAQLVTRCIEAPADLRFAVFYGVSANTWRIWDTTDAEQRLGYAPVDDAEQWRAAALPDPPSPRRRLRRR